MNYENFSDVEIETDLEMPLEMYEIPGQDKISSHAYARYLRNKEQDAAIKRRVENPAPSLKDIIESATLKERSSLIKDVLGSASFKIEDKLEAADLIFDIPREEQASLIKVVLDNPDIRVQSKAALLINSTAKEDMDLLRGIARERIESGLHNADSGAQQVAIEMITALSVEERAPFIKETFNNPDIKVAKSAAKMIEFSADEEQDSLQEITLTKIQAGLEDLDPEVQNTAVEMIRYAPSEKRAGLIREALGKSDIVVQKTAATMIKFTFEERLQLISEVLDGSSVEAQKIAAEIIKDSSWGEEPLLVKKALNNSHLEVRKIALELIMKLPVDERIPLMEEAFNSSDPETLKKAVEIIQCLPIRERTLLLKEILSNNVHEEVRKVAVKMIPHLEEEERTELIKESLDDSSVEVQKAAAAIIFQAGAEDQVRLIREALENPNVSVQKASIAAVQTVPPEERPAIIELIKDKGLADELVRPPLYDEHDIDTEKFSREEFVKTGSGTTLIGGELKGKTIIRQIEPEAFLTWQSIYENYKLWQDNGFDYVPIEPIQAYHLDSQGLVDVYSGVLDLSLGQWENIEKKFIPELRDQQQKILAVLDQEHVVHGHTHDGNFCLRFFRDEAGHVDFNKTPRLYLIDFDQSASQ